MGLYGPGIYSKRVGGLGNRHVQVVVEQDRIALALGKSGYSLSQRTTQFYLVEWIYRR